MFNPTALADHRLFPLYTFVTQTKTLLENKILLKESQPT
jgi:hypothetical protein